MSKLPKVGEAWGKVGQREQLTVVGHCHVTATSDSTRIAYACIQYAAGAKQVSVKEAGWLVGKVHDIYPFNFS